MVLWDLFNIAQQWGSDRAYEVLRLGAVLAKGQLSEHDEHELRNALSYMLTQGAEPFFSDKKNLEEFAIATAYILLRQNKITRDLAAFQAQSLLGREISTDTWRKRVDRWAERRGLPRVELYKRTIETDI